ncbi:hypothetical protein HK104_010636 [Borealophlyctis nickersoniae]|nr:hypothetical protein HK104_010636 [Borealophlyctis nickersoniae]
MGCPHGQQWGHCFAGECVGYKGKGTTPKEEDDDDDAFASPPPSSARRSRGKVEVPVRAPRASKKPRIAQSTSKGTTPKDEKNVSKDDKAQTCPTCIRNGQSGPFDHSRSSSKRCPYYKPRRAAKAFGGKKGDGEGGGGEGGSNSGGARERYKVATVVIGQNRFLRATQLSDTIENTVKEMTQLMVEGNAVLLRFILRRLEAGIEIPSLWGSNLVRQCFGATQRRSTGDPYHPKTDPRTDPEVKASRDAYRLLRPNGLPWADGSYKSDLITAATKQYVTNAQVYTIYQLIPRLRKLVQVEIFERVPLPTSAKGTKQIRARALSTIIRCLQGVAPLDTTVLRDFIEKFVDPFYTTFILDAITHVLEDTQRNILNGRPLFVVEKDPQTQQSHPTLIEAKDNFETWIPVHYAILQKYEQYARTPSGRRYRPKLAPFPIFPKYGFTPKFIIINTDQALYDIWSLANWAGVERPANFVAFKNDTNEWWRRTFRIEKVETVHRRFRGAVHMDGVSCRILMNKRVFVGADGPDPEEGQREDDDGGGGEVAVVDALEDSDDEIGSLESRGGDNGGDKKRKRKPGGMAAKSQGPPVSSPPPLPPGYDRYFRPVDIPDGTTVWAIDPGRREPIHAVNSDGLTYRVSLAHYYQLCGFTANRRRREKWLRGDATVKAALDILSGQSYRTSALATFDQYVGALLPNLSSILNFYFRRRHRRSNFDSYIRAQMAWDTILTPFRNSVVALGAALFAHNSRGHQTGPLKKLRQQLKIRVYALRLIGEFNTSRVCHRCEGFFDQGNQRWWALRVCRDVCGGRIMNRDYNAAVNILHIFLFMNHHAGQRPEPFFNGWDTLPPRPGVH